MINCCFDMHNCLLDRCKLIEYDMKTREYGFSMPNSSTVMLIDHCIFCGKKLAESLRDDWFNVLSVEYSLDDPLGRQRSKVPAEFWTDVWWKKRHFDNDICLYEFRSHVEHEEEDARLVAICKKIEEESRNYKGPHCCLTMDAGIDGDNRILFYTPYLREYQIQSEGFLVLDYCPFCGKREPQSLRKKWLEILSADYGLVDPLGKDKSKVPQDFLTDEWWKKREL